MPNKRSRDDDGPADGNYSKLTRIRMGNNRVRTGFLVVGFVAALLAKADLADNGKMDLSCSMNEILSPMDLDGNGVPFDLDGDGIRSSMETAVSGLAVAAASALATQLNRLRLGSPRYYDEDRDIHVD